MSPKKRARRFFFAKLGRVPGTGAVEALAEEFAAAEQRGEERVVALVAEHLGPACARLIADKLAESRGVPACDGVAQTGENVTDHDRATAPAEG